MTNYKMQVEHAGYWRGAVHRWSTAWSFTGSVSPANYASVILSMHTLENNVNYPDPREINGGVASIALYNLDAGGVPLARTDYFDPENPSAWVPYAGLGWSSLVPPALNHAEAALLIEWNAGLSSTGKPVKFRKFFHAVPDYASGPGDGNITPTDQSGLATAAENMLVQIAAKGLNLGKGSRLAGTTPSVGAYFVNHQMPRGRKRRLPAGAFIATSVKGVPVVGPLELA